MNSFDAVTKDKLNLWSNALVGNHNDKDRLSASYYVQGIPAYVVIDKSGNIVGRFDGSEAVDENGKLTLLLKKIFE